MQSRKRHFSSGRVENTCHFPPWRVENKYFPSGKIFPLKKIFSFNKKPNIQYMPRLLQQFPPIRFQPSNLGPAPCSSFHQSHSSRLV